MKSILTVVNITIGIFLFSIIADIDGFKIFADSFFTATGLIILFLIVSAEAEIWKL